MSKLCVVSLLLLLCSCAGQAGLVNGSGENATTDDHALPCTDPVKCCPKERMQCFGDADSGMVCTCPYLWICDGSNRKCKSADGQPVPGDGTWTCTWSKELYSCSKSVTDGTPPQNADGWTCKTDSEKQTFECSKSAPNPLNEPAGVSSWNCAVNAERQLTCEYVEPIEQPVDPDNTGTGSGTGSGSDTGTGSGSDTGSGTDPSLSGLGTGCPKVAQSVLIIDLRCGWWGDDGGARFTQSLLNSLQDPCLGNVKLEYYHWDAETVYEGYGLNAINGINWGQYSQIWFLSGKDDDPSDLGLHTPEVQAVFHHILQSSAPLFIAGGASYSGHARALAEQLGLGPAFQPGPWNWFEYMSGIGVATVLHVGSELQSHALFTGIVEGIADGLTLPAQAQWEAAPNYNQPPISDALVPSSQITVIGNNAQGQPCIGVATANNRRVVLDAGIQRFFAILGAQQVNKDTLLYLQNIISYLSVK